MEDEIMAEYFNNDTLEAIREAALALRKISSDTISEIASDIADKVGKRFACHCTAKHRDSDDWYNIYEESIKWYDTHARECVIGTVKSTLIGK